MDIGSRPRVVPVMHIQLKAMAAILAALAVAACAERTSPDATPYDDSAPYGSAPVEPGPAAAAASFTPGLWRPDTVDGARAVVFQEPQSDPVVALYCDGRRGMVVERRGLTASGPTNLMRIVVEGVDRRLAVNPIRDEGLVLRAVVPFNDAVNTALKRAPTSIILDVGEGDALRLPPAQLVQMLAVDCGRTA